MLLHLSLSILLVEKCLEQCAEGSTRFCKRKKVIENCDKLKDYQIFNISYLFLSKEDIFFTNLINLKLISELVSSDNTVFLCINATQI